MNDALREQFPILQRKTYLNSCSKGALSHAVRTAYDSYLSDWDEFGSPWEYWVERMESARTAFSSLINADADEVAVQTSVSACVSALASGLDFSGDRSKVVVSDFEFPTVAQIWHAQEARGARIVHVPANPDSRIPVERFADAIDDETLLVSITHVCFRNGARLDVPAIIKLAHEYGAMVLLDSYQALGTFPIDVKALDVDFLVGGTLKYLLASSGLAYLYVREDRLPQLNPTVGGWFSQSNIFEMAIDRHDPSPTARKFESGTPPVPNIYAGIAGIELVQSIGLDAVERQLIDLTGALKEGIRERGFALVTPDGPREHGALITVRAHDVNRLVAALAEDNIVTSSRDDNLRISPHVYNTHVDIDRLLDALTRHSHLVADASALSAHS